MLHVRMERRCHRGERALIGETAGRAGRAEHLVQRQHRVVAGVVGIVAGRAIGHVAVLVESERAERVHVVLRVEHLPEPLRPERRDGVLDLEGAAQLLDRRVQGFLVASRLGQGGAELFRLAARLLDGCFVGFAGEVAFRLRGRRGAGRGTVVAEQIRR